MGKLLGVFVLLLASCGTGEPIGDCGPTSLVVKVVGPDGTPVHEFQGTFEQPGEDAVNISCPGDEGSIANCERAEVWLIYGGGSLRLQSGNFAFYADLPDAEACYQPYTARLVLD